MMERLAPGNSRIRLLTFVAVGLIVLVAAAAALHLFGGRGTPTAQSATAALDLDDTVLHRPSLLPYFIHDGAQPHQKLIGLPEGDLDLKFLDALVPAARLPLKVSREYRSNSRSQGIFGRGWSSNLDVHLAAVGHQLTVWEADGRKTVYSLSNAGYVPLLPPTLSNTMQRTSDGSYWRAWQNGITERFDRMGRLAEIKAGADRIAFHYPDNSAPHPDRADDAAGHELGFHYDGARLIALSEPGERNIRFAYAGDALSQVSDALGRVVSFSYDTGRMTSLSLPNNQTLRFHYAATGQISAIEGPGSLRTAFTWSRLAEGAQLLSTLADGEVETTQFVAAPFIAAEWGSGNSSEWMGLQGETGLDIVHRDALGNATHLFQIGDRLLLKSDSAAGSEGIDPKGIVQRFGGDRPNDSFGVSDLRPALATIDPGMLWRTRLAPGMVGSQMPGTHYDAAGRPIEITGNGTDEKWTWDAADRLTDWISPGGVHTHYDYDALDHVTRIAVNGQIAVTADYTAMGLLAHVVHSDGLDTRYSYDGAGRVVSIVKAPGGSTLFVRDRAGRIVMVARNGIPLISVGYDQGGRIARLARWHGPELRYTYDQVGRVVREEDNEGHFVARRYDDQGRPSQTWGDTGLRNSFVYGPGTITTHSTYADGRSSTQIIDSVKHLIRVQARDGRRIAMHYGANGQPDSIEDSAAGTTRYRYDPQSRLVEISYPKGSGPSFVYDANSRLAEANSGVRKISYDYAATGKTLHIADTFGSRSLRYDARGALLARTDPAGSTVQYGYDGQGRLSTISRPDNTAINYRYGVHGQVAQIGFAQGKQQSQIGFEYDATGRLVAVAHEDGTREQFAYDNAGRLSRKINRFGQSLTYSYDAAGRVQSIAGPTGNLLTRYDTAGRVIEHDDPVAGDYRFVYSTGRLDSIDPSGARNAFWFDGQGRLTATEDALGGRTMRQYDSLGRLIAVADANGGRSAWSYDPASRSIAFRSPAGRTIRDNFDAQGRIIAQSAPGNQSYRQSYDALGRITRIETADGKSWTYTYDANGLSAATGPEGNSRFRFDGLGRLRTQTDAANRTVSYDYDAAGRVASLQTPRLGIVRYRYDSMGRVAAIAGHYGETSFVYDNASRPIKIVYSNKSSLAYAYDKGLRIAAITLSDPHGKSIYWENYVYDPRGNVISVSDPDGAQKYTYDALNRVTDVKFPDGSEETFAYDAMGNIVRHDGETAAYDADGVQTARGSVRVVSDANGDACGEAVNGKQASAICQIQFDSMGRVLHVGNARNYVWDATGRLLGINGPGKDEHLLYANGALIEDNDAPAKIERLYAPGLTAHQWSVALVNGRRYFPFWSANGTLKLLLDDAGHVVARYRTRLYGLAKIDGDGTAVPFVFAGGILDEALGAIRFGTRYMAQNGRFLSPDPNGPDRDGNRYSYALDNPLRFRDVAGASGSPVVMSWTEFHPIGSGGVTIARPVSITIPSPSALGPSPAGPGLPLDLAPPPSANLQPASYPAWNGDVSTARQTLGDIALRDPNPVVRAAASEKLQTMAAKNTAVTVEAVSPQGSLGEAHLGSDQVTLFRDGINNTVPGEVPTLNAAGTLAHEVEHASVQVPESVNPYGTQQEIDAFIEQSKIANWSAEGRNVAFINPENYADPSSIAGNLLTNPGYERARQGDIAAGVSRGQYFGGFEDRMFENLGNSIRNGREITVAGREATLTNGGTYEINTAPAVSYDVSTGKVTELEITNQPLSVTDQADRLRQLRAENAAGNAQPQATAGAQNEAAQVENVGSKTAEMPAVNFENEAAQAQKAASQTAEMPAVNFENPASAGSSAGPSNAAAGSETAEANQTRQLTEIDFDKPGAGGGELGGDTLAGDGRNAERAVADDLANAGANAGGGAAEGVSVNAAQNPAAADQSIILECENGECYRMSDSKGFERVNPDGTPYVEPGTVNPAVSPNGETAEVATAQPHGGNASAGEAAQGEGTILECANGECYRMSSSKGFERVNPDGTPYTGPAEVNPKGPTAEVPVAQSEEAAASETRAARAELDTVVENSRAPIASEIEASGATGSVESALGREAGSAELAAVERGVADVAVEEAAASLEREALSTAAKDIASTFARSAWQTVMEGAPAQFVKQLLLPMAAEALEAANPVFMVLMAKDLAETGAKILGWAGRQIGNIIANPLEKAFAQLNAPSANANDEAQKAKRKRAANDAMIQPSPQAQSLWLPSDTQAGAEPAPASNSGTTAAPAQPAASGSGAAAQNTQKPPPNLPPLGEPPNTSAADATKGTAPANQPSATSTNNPAPNSGVPVTSNAKGSSPATGGTATPNPSAQSAAGPNPANGAPATSSTATPNPSTQSTTGSNLANGTVPENGASPTTASSPGENAPHGSAQGTSTSNTSKTSSASSASRGTSSASGAPTRSANASAQQPLPPSPFGPATFPPSNGPSAPKPGTPPPEALPHTPASNLVAANTPRAPPAGLPPSNVLPPASPPPDQQTDNPPPPSNPPASNPPSAVQSPTASDEDCSGFVGQINCKLVEPMSGQGGTGSPGTGIPVPPGSTPGGNTGPGAQPPPSSGPPSGGPTPPPGNEPGKAAPASGGSNPPGTGTSASSGNPSGNPTDEGLSPPPPPPPKPPTQPAPNTGEVPAAAGNGSGNAGNSPEAPSTPPPTPPYQPPSNRGYEWPPYTPSSTPLPAELDGKGPQTVGQAFQQGGLFGALAYGWNAITNAVNEKVTKALGG